MQKNDTRICIRNLRVRMAIVLDNQRLGKQGHNALSNAIDTFAYQYISILKLNRNSENIRDK